MKRGNIFNINTKADDAFSTIVKQIAGVYSRPDVDSDKVEVEIKYADFKYFSHQNYLQYVARLPEQDKNKVGPICGFIEEERWKAKQTLKKMSHQNLLCLNDLGRAIYALAAGFDEQKHEKFYHMQEFLKRQCEFNQNIKSHNILLPENPKNIYHVFSGIGDNQSLVMNQIGEMRMDVYCKDPNSELNGRFSYSQSEGWVKTNKTQLIREQIDLMISEKTFRLAINQEDQHSVSYQQLTGISEELTKNGFKNIEVRLKKIMKCTKGGILEFSLSEVFEPKKKVLFQNYSDLAAVITEDANVLDAYIEKKFQQFYEFSSPQEIGQNDTIKKHEIECEFTKAGSRLLKEHVQKNQLKNVHYEIEEAIDCLLNLFYSDHSVKTNETVWMQKILQEDSLNHQSKVNQRLMNEFGSYMHNLLYEEMTLLKNSDL